MSAQEQPAWPDAVIARYLTLSGEVFRDPSIYVEVLRNDEQHAFYRCHCCSRQTLPEFTGVTQDQAQAHAEKCRALPRPGVAS
ncbi:hypothetical protein [Streptomyces sp. NPDC058254]|uniref:hypothetical protein n=1 Tax=Streptomyces sp. NPDC058254 TaxID=3346406 RepID=UPI0036E5B941